jgi:hypothetical protein
MIQPLRAVHRRAFVALAIVLPIILAVGLGARRPRLHPRPLAAEVPASAHLLKTADTLWRRYAIQTAFYGDSNFPLQVYVVLKPMQELSEPDLLLYWTDNQVQGETLPARARLLGPFVSGTGFALPQNTGQTSHLVLYSLAHQVVVDAASLERLP